MKKNAFETRLFLPKNWQYFGTKLAIGLLMQ
jgi:hypothetical protein